MIRLLSAQQLTMCVGRVSLLRGRVVAILRLAGPNLLGSNSGGLS